MPRSSASCPLPCCRNTAAKTPFPHLVLSLRSTFPRQCSIVFRCSSQQLHPVHWQSEGLFICCCNIPCPEWSKRHWWNVSWVDQGNKCMVKGSWPFWLCISQPRSWESRLLQAWCCSHADVFFIWLWWCQVPMCPHSLVQGCRWRWSRWRYWNVDCPAWNRRERGPRNFHHSSWLCGAHHPFGCCFRQLVPPKELPQFLLPWFVSGLLCK